jgi:hypothetical protein
MKATRKTMIFVSLGTASLFLIAAVGVFAWIRWQHHLPNDREARQQFESHRVEFVHFVSLLKQDSTATMIDSNGVVDVYTNHARAVPEYLELMRRTGAKAVYVRADGSIEFQQWGFGCAPCSDSFKGMRYFPLDGKSSSGSGWVPKLVSSLDGEDLPKENGAIADGLYVMQIEPEWFIYRLEVDD